MQGMRHKAHPAHSFAPTPEGCSVLFMDDCASITPLGACFVFSNHPAQQEALEKSGLPGFDPQTWPLYGEESVRLHHVHVAEFSCSTPPETCSCLPEKQRL